MEGSVSLFSIMSKVRLEACMWVSTSLNMICREKMFNACTSLKDYLACFIQTKYVLLNTKQLSVVI